MAGYWFDDDHCWGIEGGFFVLGQGSQNQTFTSIGLTNLAIPYVNATTGLGNVFPIAGSTAPLGLNDVGALRVDYNTQFYGYEANLRGVWCRGPCGFIDCVVGYRGLGLNENLNFTAITSGVNLPAGPLGTGFPGFTQRTISDHFGTQNTFYGGQVGLVMEHRSGCWVFDLTTKLAVGVTRETVNINGGTLDMVAGGPTTAIPTGFFAQQSNSGRFQQNQLAVVPEIGLTVGYQFTERLRAFVGYNFIYWSRVVRPGDQINPVPQPGHDHPRLRWNDAAPWHDAGVCLPPEQLLGGRHLAWDRVARTENTSFECRSSGSGAASPRASASGLAATAPLPRFRLTPLTA